MPKYRTELFGQFIYSPDISYDDMLSLEDELKVFVSEKMEEFGGAFLHFESEGDRTFFQCVFSEFDENLFNATASALNRTDGKVESKLFFVDKELVSAYFYALSKGKLSGHKVSLPAAGPVDKALLAETK